MKVAFLSMDIEDWYHTTYLRGAREGAGPSMLDGVEEFAQILEEQGITATFFVLSCLANGLASTLRRLAARGHEIACHGDDHSLPNRQSDAEFTQRLKAARQTLEDVIGQPVVGYRAPCFALDETKVAMLGSLGFAYDASLIDFTGHRYYGRMQLNWPEITPGIRRAPGSDFLEFEISTLRWGGRQMPIAGGGAFRILPWPLTRRWTAAFLSSGRPYTFYIHPFECSALPSQTLPRETAAVQKLHFRMGRASVHDRIRRLIELLRSHDYRFATHKCVVDQLLQPPLAVSTG
jgi:polysaccharide deacetylase family protein (PEP-CTERM system associated)